MAWIVNWTTESTGTEEWRCDSYIDEVGLRDLQANAKPCGPWIVVFLKTFGLVMLPAKDGPN